MLGSALTTALLGVCHADNLLADKLVGVYSYDNFGMKGQMEITQNDDDTEDTVEVKINTSNGKGATCTFQGYAEVHFTGVIIFYDPEADSSSQGTYSYNGMAAIPTDDGNGITMLNSLPSACSANVSLIGTYTRI